MLAALLELCWMLYMPEEPRFGEACKWQGWIFNQVL